MSPLAEAVYDILRRRTRLADPRITYRDLAQALRDRSEEFEFVTHRSRHLYAALWEIGDECRRLDLPCLPALVVRADTGRPGDAYYEGPTTTGAPFRGKRIAAWRSDLEAVKAAVYPRRSRR